MTAKQYLQQVYRFNEAIEVNLREYDKLRDTVLNISSQNTPSIPFSIAIPKLMLLEKELDAEIDRYVDLRRKIEEEIMRIHSKAERDLLFTRYINFMSWEDIAQEMNRTVKYVYKLHKKALKDFGERA